MTTIFTPAIPTTTMARTLHLVDLENLVGDPYANGDAAEAVFDQYLQVAR